MGTGEFNAGGNPVMDEHPVQGGVEILLVASCHRNQDVLQPDGPFGLHTLFPFCSQICIVTNFLFLFRAFFHSEQVVQQVFDELGLTLTDEVSSVRVYKSLLDHQPGS